MADRPLKSITFPGLEDKYTIPEIDATLTQQGEAADAKKTGNEISGVKNTLNQFVRPNLLDNWYFGNPVNQRGQSSYSNAYPAYTIDRWFFNGSLYGGATISSNGYITLNNFSYYAQKIEANTSSLVGKQVTLSILTDTNLYYGTIVFPAASADSTTVTVTNVGVLKIYNENAKYFQFYLQSANPSNMSCNVIAFKAELGSGQTLAHNEGTDANPVWVLNEIPNYSEELTKCQRYYLPLGYSVKFEGMHTTGDNVQVFVPTPVTMASIKTITLDQVAVIHASGVINTTSKSISDILNRANGVLFICEVNDTLTLADYSFASFGLINNGSISADL